MCISNFRHYACRDSPPWFINITGEWGCLMRNEIVLRVWGCFLKIEIVLIVWGWKQFSEHENVLWGPNYSSECEDKNGLQGEDVLWGPKQSSDPHDNYILKVIIIFKRGYYYCYRPLGPQSKTVEIMLKITFTYKDHAWKIPMIHKGLREGQFHSKK